MAPEPAPLAPTGVAVFDDLLSRIRALPEGRWVASGAGGALMLDRALRVERRWDFGQGAVSIDDDGERAAVAEWPDVAVYDDDGLVATFQSPTPEYSTTVLFDEGLVWFVGLDDDLDEADFAVLHRGDLETGQVEVIGRTDILGYYEILTPRDAIPGLFVTAWDGQHGAATAYFSGADASVGERIGSRGIDWTAVFDTSPDGSLYLEGGRSVAIRRWADRSALPLDLPADLASPVHFTEGRFLDASRVVLFQAPEWEITTIDLEKGIRREHRLLDQHGGPLQEYGVCAAADGRLCVLTRQFDSVATKSTSVLLVYEL